MARSRSPSPTGRWYAENTREPLRDEVISQGLVPVNAVLERTGIATTSPLGRYCLRRDFGALFAPTLNAAAFKQAAGAWRFQYLAPAALARAALVRTSASTSSANITVQCPRGPSTILPPSPSPLITKAVIEVFAPAYLGDPRVAWVSDSASKRPFRDPPLEQALQIKLDAAELLPDVVLVDINPPGRPGKILIVFVEVVASDGQVTEQRQRELLTLIAANPRGYGPQDAAFVTAYLDRGGVRSQREEPHLRWHGDLSPGSSPNRRTSYNCTMALQLHVSLQRCCKDFPSAAFGAG